MTTLPASGVITLGDVNVALGLARTTQISLGQASVRTLFGVATGAISLSNGYGKSSSYNLTISANTLKYNLRTALIAAGYSGTGTFKTTITINSGVYVWSDTTATAAFDTGVLSGGTITIINNGYIIGMGGNGAIVDANNGGAGGPAMNIQHSVTMTNNSYVAGGGGGGGSVADGIGRGGGGGGGAGGGFGGHWLLTTVAVGGAPGLAGSNGPGNGAGGGGGRILPGVGGASTYTSDLGGTLPGNGGGAGGGGGCYAGTSVQLNGGTGGAGGSADAVGNNGYDSGFRSSGGGGGGGGGWGASGGTAKNYPLWFPAPPGAGGKCVNLNGYTVTWSATGTRYGVIS